jgi:ribose transport system permease protein
MHPDGSVDTGASHDASRGWDANRADSPTAPPESATGATAAQSSTRPLRDRIKSVVGHGGLRDYLVYVTIVLVFGAFAITLGDEGFLDSFNLLNILRQAVPIAIMAMALVFVLSAGEIDLSLGSVIALSALVAAMVVRDAGFALGVLAGVGTGIGVGLFNGLVVTKVRVPSFLVTLATLELVAGLARTVTQLESVPVVDETYISIFGGGKVGPIDTLFLWGLGFMALAALIFYGTRFGAHVRATGDNRSAAITSGIRTDRIRIYVLILAGLAAAIAGMLYVGRLEGARYTLGENDLLLVYAAAIVGGTSLFGGRGSIVGAAAGAVLLAMINNGLILYGLSVSEQRIALGVILLLAIAFSRRVEERT